MFLTIVIVANPTSPNERLARKAATIQTPSSSIPLLLLRVISRHTKVAFDIRLGGANGSLTLENGEKICSKVSQLFRESVHRINSYWRSVCRDTVIVNSAKVVDESQWNRRHPAMADAGKAGSYRASAI